MKQFTKLRKCTSIGDYFVDDSIYLTHGESTKDKEFELEMSWISTTDTNNLHQPVPKDLLDDAETQAKKEDEDEEMGDAE